MSTRYTRIKWSDFLRPEYNDREWNCIKWCLMPLILLMAIFTIEYLKGQVIHQNICSCIDCSVLIRMPFNYLAIAAFTVFGICYLFEIRMLWTLPALFVLSVLVFSYAESLGLKGEYGLISLIFLTQFIAYLRHHLNGNTNLATERIQFPVQLLAAAYTLSAISKLQVSGIAWFNESAVNFALQVFREYSCAYSSSGNLEFQQQGAGISTWLLEHLWFMKLILGLSVLVEACAFILMTGKRNAFYYAFLLICLHIGIYLTMHILLYTIVVPMLAFTINPLYQLVLFADNVKNRLVSN